MKVVFSLLILAAAAFTSIEVEGKQWALLIAGSNGYYNYRHQADICHAYQILHSHGIPDENIVVMMYDDIADSYHNPTKGKIINRPNGPDVYHGVLKDYTKEDVTPQNFLNILLGKKEKMAGIGSGKVIASGPDDDVFVYFADHGAPGLIAFPSSEMVFYIEACESGSMFDQLLPSDIKVFATTAANSRESSYACYWDEKRHTYLGDVYSVKWMEDSDKEDLTVETLLKQYEIVKKETNTSHVKKFGDMSMENEPLSLFQGSKKSNTTTMGVSKPITDAVPSPDVPLMILQKRLQKARTKVEYRQIEMMIAQEKKTRSTIRLVVKKIVAKLAPTVSKEEEFFVTKPAALKERECYENAVGMFKEKCFNFSKYEYALRQLYVLSNLCDEGIPSALIKTAMDSACK
eukprot:gene20213-22189_t